MQTKLKTNTKLKFVRDLIFDHCIDKDQYNYAFYAIISVQEQREILRNRRTPLLTRSWTKNAWFFVSFEAYKMAE